MNQQVNQQIDSPLESSIKAIQDDSELEVYLRNLREFDQMFCDAMASGRDFTIRLEVHGNFGTVHHCRAYRDLTDKVDVLKSERKKRKL